MSPKLQLISDKYSKEKRLTRRCVSLGELNELLEVLH